MKSRLTAVACAGLAVVVAAGAAFAAQQLAPTRLLLVRNPTPGGIITNRKILFRIQDGPASTLELTGNPTQNGATLRIRLASGGDQCFDLPAASWVPISSVGYKYRDSDGPGAVAAVLVKKTGFAGTFIVKAKLASRLGPIDVIPMINETAFDADFQIVGGDDYCAGGTTPAGSTVTEKVYNVKNVTVPASCGVATCAP